MKQKNSDSVVAVTGAASGIGLALARGLLGRGYQVLALDIGADRLQDLPAQLGDPAPGRLRTEAVDVTDESAIARVVQECEQRFGPIHGLVNSAGIAAEQPCLDTSVETFRRILDVNVIGSFIVSREVGRAMRRRRSGSMVNIASVSGMRGNYGRVAYGASKAAMIQMTRVMAVELAHDGVRVNAVAPGPINTPLAQSVHSEQTRKNWNAVVAMGRYGEPEELFGAVDWLLDNAASGYVTGQVIAVDGGFTAMGLPVP